MPHIHPDYDFVVSAFIVNRGRVLLIHHKSYDKWLPIGGHIELDEDPEEALYREIREECGLPVRVLAERAPVSGGGVKAILRPAFVDVHPIKGRHRHIAFVYFARSSHRRVKLHVREHSEFRWFSREELSDRRYRIMRSIRYYCLKALEAV